MKDCETCKEHNCMECEVPGIEPEDCETCSKQAEEDGVEYEHYFTHKDGYWKCAECGKAV